jgi:hypothetical protein
MRTWSTRKTVPASRAAVLRALTEPQEIERWAPVPFELLELDTGRLATGSRALVHGRLAGRSVEFEVDVLEASNEHLSLVANGPVRINVDYALRPANEGSEVRATISVRGRGFIGRGLATAAEALLGAGALQCSIERLGRALEPATLAA